MLNVGATMRFLQILTYIAFLGFVLGMIDAFLETIKNPPQWIMVFMKNSTPHWVTFLCGFWLLIAAMLEIANAIRDGKRTSSDKDA